MSKSSDSAIGPPEKSPNFLTSADQRATRVEAARPAPSTAGHSASNQPGAGVGGDSIKPDKSAETVAS